MRDLINIYSCDWADGASIQMDKPSPAIWSNDRVLDLSFARELKESFVRRIRADPATP